MNHLIIRGLYLLAALVLSPPAWAQVLDTGFDPDANGPVRAIAVAGDGRLLIAGGFTQVGGQTRNRLARLRNDGAVDTSMAASVDNGAVRAVLVDHVGDYVVAGGFTTVNGSTRNRVARLTPLGQLDAGFNPNANDVVHALLEVPASKALYLAGAFTQVGGQPRSRVARVLDNGNLDAGFAPPAFTGTAQALALQPDGRLVVGGSLALAAVPGSGSRVYRLNANGTLDAGFVVNVGISGIAVASVNAVAVQADGAILIAGEFTSVNGQPRSRVARLMPDGALDASFVPPAVNDTVHSLVLQPDGRAVIGGDFTGLSLRNRIARLNHDGSLDGGFAGLVDPDAAVLALAVRNDGSVAIGGSFTGISGIDRNRVAVLDQRGAPDNGMQTANGVDAAVEAVALQADDRIVLAGRFTQVGGQPRNRLARLLPGGGLDLAFDPSANSDVYAVHVLPDRKLLVAGSFSNVGGGNRNRIARLHPDGNLDTSFGAGAVDGFVRAVVVQPDGRILIGGSFQTVGGQPRRGLARLLADGAVDPAFTATDVDGVVRALVRQANGNVLIGGDFALVGGFARSNLAQVGPNGGVTGNFLAGSNGPVWALAQMRSGTVLAGGNFTSIQGVARSNLAAMGASGAVIAAYDPSPNNGTVHVVLPLSNGQVVIGGGFLGIGGTIVHRLALISAGGSLLGINPNVNGGPVLTGSVQPDGRILFAGAFTSALGQPRGGIARLASIAATTREIEWQPGAGQVDWRLGSFDNGLVPAAAPSLLISATCCDPAGFEPVPGGATMQAVAGGWRLTGFPDLPGTFYLRVRAPAGDGKGAGTGLYETPIRQFWGGEDDDTIFRNGFQ